MEKYYFKTDCPQDIENVKELGAIWDETESKWCVHGKEELDGDLIDYLEPKDAFKLFAPIYLMTSAMPCWKCKKETKVYAIGCHKIQLKHPNDALCTPEDLLNYIIDARDFAPDGLLLISNVKHFGTYLTEYLKRSAKTLYHDYSKTMETHYIMNHCEHCSSKIGDYGVFEHSHAAGGAAFCPYGDDKTITAKTIHGVDTIEIKEATISEGLWQMQSYFRNLVVFTK